MARQPKGRPTIYLGGDGEYHSWLTIGTYPNGRPKRKHFHRSTATAVAEAMDEYAERVKRGHGAATKIETVAQWMTYYVEHVVKGNREYATWRDVDSLNRLYITPSLGQWRLTGTKRRLEPEHVEAMYETMRARDLSDHYIRRTHVHLRRALKVAVRRGRADRNVCEMFDPPTARRSKPQPLKQNHAIAVLMVALADELAARWALGLIAGPRQGEVLGLRWHRVEIDPEPPAVPHIWIARKLQRQTYRHGCPDPVACVRGQQELPCRTRPCPPKYAHGCGKPLGCKKFPHFCPAKRIVPGCNTHRHDCPPVCPADCAGHAKLCPQRLGGLVEGRTKTETSDAPIAIGSAVAELLRRHRERQQRTLPEGGTWDTEGLVFTTKDGRPIDPHADWEAWRSLLVRAKVPHSKLHAARDTAGTFLRATGADLALIQEQLRHADMATTRGYVGVALEAQHEALEKAAAALLEGEFASLLVARKVALHSSEMR